MKQFYLLGFLILALLSNAPNANAMEISSGGSSELITFIELDGEVEVGDFRTLVQTIRKMEAFPDVMFITSPGGDVEEAIRIGRFFREGMLQVYAQK
jgi:hypothetical protein